jgi:FlaG/FlaF family flagellin (archaellin)
MSRRAQSEAVGTVLMAGIAVVVVAGLVVTGSSIVDDAQRDAPSAAFAVAANGSTVQLTHESGEALDVADVEVVFRGRGASTTRRVGLAAFDERGDGDGRVTAGESFATTNPLVSSPVTIRVVHRPSELVLVRRTLELAPGGLNFGSSSTAPRDSAINRNSSSATIAVEDGGSSVNATGNGWWEVPYDYNVTPDTMLSFTFRSAVQCEIHGIGLETDDRQTEGRVVRVYGTQSWGEPVDQFAGQSTYSGSGTTSYTVPIGELYEDNGYLSPGNPDRVNKILFVNDCDSGPTDAVNSEFENVRVYESS